MMTMKKLLSMMMILAMVFCLGMTTAYAEDALSQIGGQPPMQEGGMGGGRPGGKGGEDMGTPPELPEGVEAGERPERPEGMEEGDLPELPEGVEPGEGGMGGGRRGGKDGEMGGMGMMLDTESLQSAVDSLGNSEATTSISTLLAAYEAALEAERTSMDGQTDIFTQPDEATMTALREQVTTALTALEEALTALGLDISAYGIEPEMPEGGQQNIGLTFYNPNEAT